jgi:hypothetical protein
MQAPETLGDAANNTKDVKHPVILLVEEVVRYLEVVCYRA